VPRGPTEARAWRQERPHRAAGQGQIARRMRRSRKVAAAACLSCLPTSRDFLAGVGVDAYPENLIASPALQEAASIVLVAAYLDYDPNPARDRRLAGLAMLGPSPPL